MPSRGDSAPSTQGFSGISQECGGKTGCQAKNFFKLRKSELQVVKTLKFDRLRYVDCSIELHYHELVALKLAWSAEERTRPAGWSTYIQGFSTGRPDQP